MIESLIVYSTLCAIMAICGAIAAHKEAPYAANSGIYENNKRFLLQPEIIFLIAAFTFVFGCRWGVGVDYFHYLYLFQHEFYDTERIEPLFKGISAFLSRSGFHFAFFFGLWALVEITLFYAAFRNYRFIFPLLAFFLIFGSCYMSMMNVIRQQVAACIFLFSLQYIEKKKIVPYLLCLFIAYQIHHSAIILVIAYPILRFRSDWFKSITLQIVIYAFCLFLNFHQSIVIEWIEAPFRWFTDTFNYGQYGYNILFIDSLNDKNQFGRNTGLGIYTNILRILPVLVLSKDMKKFYNSKFFDKIYSLWFVYVSFGLAVSDSIVLMRPFVYLADLQPVMMAFFCYYCFKQKKALYHIIAIGIMLIYIALFINIISYGNVNTSAFTFFWQHEFNIAT